MDQEISINEIAQNLKKISKKSTAGPSGCNPKLLKWLFDLCPKFIQLTINELFTKNFESHTIAFTKFIKLLRKSAKKDYLTIKSFHSISLINGCHKLLDSILYERFLTILEKTPILTNQFNFAYRAGLSCASSYHILKDFLNLTGKNKEKDYLIFNMDFEGAFDSIAATYLNSFLSYLNFPKNFILYFSKLASQQSAILKNFWSRKI